MTRVISSLSRIAFALAAAGVIAAASMPSANAVAAPAITTDPAQAAASWLAGRMVDSTHQPSPSGDHFEFNFNGTYYYDGGTTADTIYALAAAKVGATKVAAAMDSITAKIGEYTNVDGSQGASAFVGSAAKAALAAIIAGRDPKAIGGYDLIDTIVKGQCTAVSHPAAENNWADPECPAIGAGLNSYSSVAESFILLALARADVVPDATRLEYFLSLQCPDGGFTSLTTNANCASDVDATAYAMFALKALGGHDTELVKATTWLKSQANADGYFVSQGGPNTDSTGLAAAALAQQGQDISVYTDWLAGQQILDGPTFGPDAARGALLYQDDFTPASIKATADGILGLVGEGSLASVTASGAAATLPVFQAEGIVKRESVVAGKSQSVQAVGFTPGETVVAVLHSAPVTVGTTKAQEDGLATLTFVIPSGTPAGTHEIVLTGTSSGLVATVPFAVTAAPAPPAPKPSTGASGQPAPVAQPAHPETPTIAATGLDAKHNTIVAAVGMMLIALGLSLVIGVRARAAQNQRIG